MSWDQIVGLVLALLVMAVGLAGSLLPGIAAHATNNLLALVQVSLLPDSWWRHHAYAVAPASALLAIVTTLWLHRHMTTADQS